MEYDLKKYHHESDGSGNNGHSRACSHTDTGGCPDACGCGKAMELVTTIENHACAKEAYARNHLRRQPCAVVALAHAPLGKVDKAVFRYYHHKRRRDGDYGMSPYSRFLGAGLSFKAYGKTADQCDKDTNDPVQQIFTEIFYLERCKNHSRYHLPLLKDKCFLFY